MIRLEQVRGAMLERFERIDRRFAQNEPPLGRIDQRLADLTDQLEWLRQLLARPLELLTVDPDDGLLDDEPSVLPISSES